MNMKTIALGVISVATLSLLPSCGKLKEKKDMTTCKDQNQMESLFDDIYKTVDEVSSSTSGIKTYSNGCIDTIIVDTTVTPKTILIDFGQDDCEGNDGRVRKGMLHVTYTGRYRDEGTVITITPENFSIDSYGIEGTKTIVNNGLNSDGRPYYSVNVNSTITAPNGEWTATCNSARTRTWQEGYSTPINIYDDVYYITGSASGVNRLGINYNMNIDEALVAKVGCSYLVQGVMSLVPEDGPTRVIDWGSGECNNGLTVTVGNQSYEVNGGN